MSIRHAFLFMEYRGIKIGEFISNKFDNLEWIAFFSEESLYDYDLIICDLNELNYEFPKSDYFTNKRDYENFFQFFDKRKEELKKYVKEKKIIFFTPYEEKYTPLEALNNVLYRNKLDLLPFILQSEKNIGNRIEIVSDTVFSNFFKKYLSLFNYEVIISSIFSLKTNETLSCKTLCNIEKTSINVASMIENNICLFPNLNKDLSKAKELEFIQDIVNTLFPYQNIEKEEIPAWANKYKLLNEIELETKIQKLEKEKELLLNSIKNERIVLTETIDLKRLFTGTGNELENQVEFIFKELGVKLLPKQPNRDDLIIEFDSKIAVIEVKGVTKSASEKQAVQLNKWVANYHEDKEIEPKGILIVNPFKDLELSKRNFNDFFPNQMLDFSKKKEFCLISTVQLLGLFIESKNNPQRKDELIESLFTTIGVYKDFQDWQTYLDFKKE